MSKLARVTSSFRTALLVFVVLCLASTALISIASPSPAEALTSPPITLDGDFCGADDWEGAWSDFNGTDVTPEQDGLLDIAVIDGVEAAVRMAKALASLSTVA